MRLDAREACSPLHLALLATVLVLAGCAGGNSQLRADLKAADKPCHDATWPDKTQFDECLTQHERAVWARDEPSTLDLYDAYAKERADLARQVDQGAVPKNQYDDKLIGIDDKFKDEIAARRKAAASGSGSSSMP